MTGANTHNQHAALAALSSNGVSVPFDERLFAPMRDSNDLLGDASALRERYEQDGYVLLRGLLSRADVWQLRTDYFRRFEPALFAPGSDPADGIFSGTLPAGLPDHGMAGHPAYDLVRSVQFDAFTRNPRLAQLAEMLLAGPVDLVPRRIVRHFYRGRQKASRAHVDYDYMDQGSDQVVTEWIPLGDCPIECGGLIYLEGSHALTRGDLAQLRSFTDRPDDARPVSNDLGRTARTLGRRWLWTDYRAGDVVAHSPHMVHASLDNQSDVMRLSADLRFRRHDAQRDERWDGDWSADDGF